MALTSISDRLTPSAPIEITFGAQPVAQGRKITTLFAHRALVGGAGLDYEAYMVVNVGDPVKAQAEVDLEFGAGSQAGKMAYAFVAANAFVGRSNFPAFRIICLPFAVTDFGPADEAIITAKTLRSDMFVSCYPASNAAANLKLKNLCALISGPDRDLNGQFGSFFTVGSLDVLSAALLYNINSRYAQVAYLQDTNSAAVVGELGDTTAGQDIVFAIASTVGIYEGASISGLGIAVGAKVIKVMSDKVQVSLPNTGTFAGSALTIQNHVSNDVEIVAAAHAAAQMASAFPYNPLQGVAIGGLIPPKKRSEWILIDPQGASEQALIGGLSPLTVQPGNIVGFIRTRTTYVLLPDGVTAVNDYFDWQQLVALNDFREVCYQITQLPPFNNNPGGTKASVQVAAKLKDEVLREAQLFEELGAFQNVKLLAKSFQVSISTTSRGRFDFKIPVDVIPGLYVIAGNIQAISDATNFTV